MSTINNNSNYNYHGVSFKTGEPQSKIPIITKPIDKVENIVNNTVDTFIPETQDEEKKKSHKTMIRVGSTVLVLSTIVALLNPKFSSNLVKKLKTKSANAGNKAKIDNSFFGKLNKAKEKTLNGITNIIQILNNVNSTKDTLLQKLCNKSSITQKIHKNITNGFDKISRQTVFAKYNKVNKKISELDNIIKQYKGRLSAENQKLLEEKLAEISRIQEYFNNSQIKTRLETQEKTMSNLERDVTEKIKNYKDAVLGKGGNKKDICNFWAEDILMPERNRLEEEGKVIIDSLIGDGKTKKGIYNDIIDILSPHLKSEEKAAFEDSIKSAGKFLRKANHSECIEYFDKKRDLMLGSAPTDVLTAVGSLIASGVAIGIADTKEDRISRTITGALPVIAGLGVSTALTALLYSGGKGMALGAASSMALSGIGSAVNRIIYPKNKSDMNIAQTNEKEVKNDEIKQA